MQTSTKKTTAQVLSANKSQVEGEKISGARMQLQTKSYKQNKI